MAVLRRIFREMASGTSAGEMIRKLDADGILNPTGLDRWNKKSIAHFLSSELYEPRRGEELVGLVPGELIERLDPERVYGLWHYNRRKMTTRKEWDGERFVKRYSAAENPREQWLSVPVDITEAGLDRGRIERARERSKDRYRKPSNAAGRFWQLRGIAKCGECGAVLSPQTVGRTRADGSKPKNFYYQCRRKFNTGPKTCDHTRSYPAAGMEELIWESTQGLLRHPERLQKAYEEEIERKKRSLLRDPEKETRTLTEQLEKLERRESGYYDLAADGLMSRDALRGKLTEAERQRKELEDGLRSVRNQAQSIEELRRAMLTVFARFEELRSGELRYLNPEGRRKLYGSLDLRAEVCRDGTVTLAGIFPEDISLPDLIGEHLDRTTEPPEPAVGHDVVVASGSSNSRTL
ncbi:MAG: recombinase zinc beta ribbon domain-containing protein [Actinomycetota bacterium]|nr:recombinase zinc beta ribbon domain-containing protein [Actinomycetota bacterium]